jgi:hypothetical protein
MSMQDRDIKDAVSHMLKENRQAKIKEVESPPSLPLKGNPTMTAEEFMEYRLQLASKQRLKNLGF